MAKQPQYQQHLQKLAAMLPKTEAPIVEDFISDWSLFGADKARLKQDASTSRKSKKNKNKNKKIE